MILEAIAATVLVSLVSLVGVLLLTLKKQTLNEAVFYILSFATGSLLAAAFLDLLPEAIGDGDSRLALGIALGGMILFFVMERFVHWHHEHHDHSEHEKPVAYLVLAGDALHNFFDGVSIAASFSVSPALGATTTLAIMLHEIPQELSDFTLLIYAGFSTKKAIATNLLVAFTAILGALAFFYLANYVEHLETYGLALAAGGFIYIAGSDLIPELHKEKVWHKTILQLLAVLAGIAAIWLLTAYLGV